MSVLRVEEVERSAYCQGKSFGAAGPAQLRRLLVEHAVDPGDPRNQAIVDLAAAPRDDDGRVRFEHDVVIVEPAEPAKRSGWAIVDIVNRGNPTVPTYLMLDERPPFPPPTEPPPGDGSLLERGWTLVYCGWQFDIAGSALLGLRAPLVRDADGAEVRGRAVYRLRPAVASGTLPLTSPGHWCWQPAPGGERQLWEGDEAVAAGEWRFTASGTGVVRDGGVRPGVRYRCEYDAVGAVVTGCGLLALRDVVAWLRREEQVERAVLFGVSQSGRLIRELLLAGMNVDEDGAAVYDGMLALIAGGRGGHFNERFTVPGALPDSPDEVDPARARWGVGLGEPAPDGARRTRLLALNTSNEYWRGDAALVHDDPHPDVRIHHVAGTQHPTGVVPQLFEFPVFGWRGQHGFNTVDYRPVARALLAQLVDWIDGGHEPEPSTLPGADQLSDRAAVLAHFGAQGKATPAAVSFPQPAGPVPAVDAIGNEVGGIALPDVAAPIGVHTGWNVRHPDVGSPDDEMFLTGSTWWFDELPPLEEHLAACRQVLDGLVVRRLVRSADVATVLAGAEARWHEADARRRSG